MQFSHPAPAPHFEHALLACTHPFGSDPLSLTRRRDGYRRDRSSCGDYRSNSRPNQNGG
ncbi:hypothetical protein [Candidatus Phycosocius spiralis]|uniref:hypothetical protein n=1 Tax=Candidatus Phycosocius spiralis TaxID=2815099 RepID=UPI0024E10738|nr:hypothetical protein [Candidatus Phycosocius spiralis]